MLWDLNPVLLSIGPLEIRWYGLVYALGFILAYYVLVNAKVFERKRAEEYVFLLVMGSIIASRLFYVFVYNPGYYLTHLLEIPAVWQGGLSIHGGLLGGIGVTYWFCKKHNKSFYDIADVLIVPLTFVLVFGRIANYVNGELWGTVTSVPWCVEFPGAEGCRHPSQLYEALYSLVIFATLLAIRVKQQAKGVLFWSFVTLYGLLRFLTTFFREPDPTDPVLFSLAIGQWLSLGMVAIGVWWFAKRK